ncbi:CsbD family protein [Streptomyces sp. NPDC051909]|uniref:CsbD family protein n=1 Tax=Streptomyces sp. NPDC051909 TaxID=3154944 RepID=UPI0034324848
MAEGKKMRGKAQEAVGKVKEMTGEATGKQDLRLKGVRDQVKGRAQQAAGEAEKTVKGTVEEANGKMRRHT